MDYRRAILNFSFIVPGSVAGMARPGVAGPLKDDLAFLKDEGIRAILSVSETALEKDVMGRNDFSYLHVPIDDFTAPTIGQVEECTGFMERMVTVENRPIVVHCGAGCGRTGTILACYLVKGGKSAEEAIGNVRSIRPCSIETDGQKALIFHYEEYLKYR